MTPAHCLGPLAASKEVLKVAAAGIEITESVRLQLKKIGRSVEDVIDAQKLAEHGVALLIPTDATAMRTHYSFGRGHSRDSPDEVLLSFPFHFLNSYECGFLKGLGFGDIRPHPYAGRICEGHLPNLLRIIVTLDTRI